MVAAKKSATSVAAIPRLFDECQRSFASHRKAAAVLRKIQVDDPESFAKVFTQQVDRLLLVFKREPAVERLVQFVVSFSTNVALGAGDAEEDAGDTNFAPYLLAYLIRYANAKEKSVRFRVCQFVGGLLAQMSEEAEISDELWETVQNEMLLRATDKVPAVRAQAIKALTRLQDPSEVNDPAMTTILRAMEHDPSKEVRKMALSAIAMTRSTLPYVLQRLHDVKEDVRREAVLLVGTKINMLHLTIQQRIDVLRGALRDRSAMVRDACSGIIKSEWYSKASEKSAVAFVRALDVETYEEVAETAARCVLEECVSDEAGPFSGAFAPALETIDAESAFVWRVFCMMLKERKQLDALEDALPELSSLVDSLAAIDFSTQIFTAKQLLQLAVVCDMSDEAGRRRLVEFLEEKAGDAAVVEELVEPLLAALRAAVGNAEFLDRATRLVWDVYRPIHASDNECESVDPSEDLAVQRQKLDMLYEEKRTCSARGEDCDELNQRIEALSVRVEQLEDVETAKLEEHERVWSRALALCRAVFERSRPNLSSEGTRRLYDEIVLSAMRNENPGTRNEGLRCLALLCLGDRAAAIAHVPLFFQALENEMDFVQLTALQAVFDLILVYGEPVLANAVPSPAEGTESDDEQQRSPRAGAASSAEGSTRHAYSTLLRVLDHTDSEMRTCAAESFARLLMTGRVSSVEVLAKLTVLFFNPTTEEDVRLRQCLSVFFPAYAFRSVDHQYMLERAFMPVVRVILHAPKTSPLSKVSALQVAQFLLFLTNPESAAAETGGKVQFGNAIAPSIHERVAFVVANEVLSNPVGRDAQLLCRVLNALALTPEMVDTLRALRVLVSKIREAVSDRVTLGVVAKFAASLQQLMPEGTQELSPDEMAELEAQTEKHMEDRSESMVILEREHAMEFSRDKRTTKRRTVKKTVKFVSSDSETSEEENDDEISVGGDSDGEGNVDQPRKAPAPPARRSSRRSAAAASKRLVEDEEDSDVEELSEASDVESIMEEGTGAIEVAI